MTVRRHRVRGVDLAVDDPGGDGVPFVWAHGLTSCGALEDSVGVFGWRRLERARVIRYDARGHGASGGTPDAATYTWPELSADLLGVMDAAGIDRCAAGGASMGCATAIHAAVAMPSRVERLVLVIPPTAWETRAASRDLNLAGARLLEDAGPQAVVDALQQQPPLAVLGDLGERWRDAGHQQLLEMDSGLLPSIFRGAASSDLPSVDVIASVAAPALVLAWSGDATHPVSTAERLADALPNAHLHIADDLAAIRGWTGLVDDFLT